MNRMQKYSLYKIFILLTMLCLSVLAYSCASTKDASKAQKNETTNETTIDKPTIEEKSKATKTKAAGTLLSLPAKNELVKKQLDAGLLANIEKGTPLSLKSATLYIQNDSKGMTQTNKVYLKIISDMMYLLYPWETDAIAPPFYTDDNDLLKALQSVKHGIYPQAMKKESFLELVIPTLVLSTNKTPAKLSNSYKNDIKERLLKAKKMRSNSVLPYYLLGLLSQYEHHSYDASVYYKKAWNLDHSCYPAGLKYGELLAESGDGNSAIKIAQNLEKFYPKRAEVKKLYAKAYIAKEEWDTASKYIVEILRDDPDNLSALLLRVRVLIEQEEYLKANALLDAYSTKSTTAKDYLLFRAMISKEWNRNMLASMEYLSKAYKLYPQNFKVLLACAEVCFETSEKICNKSANFFIQRVLEKNPENISALSLLVQNHINNANWSKAIALAEKLHKKSPSKANKKLLTRAYLGAKNYKTALRLAERLYYSTKKPKTDTIELYAKALFYSRNYKKLNNVISKNMRTSNSELKSILYYYKAKMNVNNGDAYLSALRSSLLANPRNKDALFSMYSWYFTRKDYRKAKYYLGQVIALDPQNKKMLNLSKKLDKLLAE